jgi:hypothetical protein
MKIGHVLADICITTVTYYVIIASDVKNAHWPVSTKCNQIYDGLLIKSNLKKKHIHHLYVAASFAARGRDTDLLNDAFKTRKLSNFYSVSQTIIE